MKNSKLMPKSAVAFIPVFVLCLFITAPSARSMESSNFNIQLHQLSQPLPDSQSQQTPTNTVTIESSGSLSLTSDSDTILFDMLSPTNPLLRTSTITATGTIPYDVLLSEDHSLANTKNGQLIPDTTCDNGTCSETVSSSWNNPLTYGFGYSCLNSMSRCNNSTQSISYLQVPNTALNKHPQIILSGIGKQTAKLTYKVNISGTQNSGIYQNTITYFIIPSY